MYRHSKKTLPSPSYTPEFEDDDFFPKHNKRESRQFICWSRRNLRLFSGICIVVTAIGLFLAFFPFGTVRDSKLQDEQNETPLVVFPTLSNYVENLLSTTPTSKKRICIITGELDGLLKSGGIGTAYTALALKMAQSGHNVSVFYVGKFMPTTAQWDYWSSFYEKQGVTILKGGDVYNLIGCGGVCIHAYRVFMWLLPYEHSFDIIHSPDNGGMAYFMALSKHQNMRFLNTTFCVGAHGPHLWERLANKFLLDELRHIEIDFIERSTAKIVDWIVSPSQYILRWMIENKWELTQNAHVHQNLLPYTDSFEPITHKNSESLVSTREVSEIVFFGRLETRKGLLLFCDALKLIPAESIQTVTFMGKDTFLPDAVLASDFVKQFCSEFKLKCQVFDTLSHSQAIEYLHRAGKLAIIPSPIDNSPNTVLECLTDKIPFLASDVGGISELVHPEDRDKVLFLPNAENIANKIQQTLSYGSTLARLSQEEYDRHKVWDLWHSSIQQTPLKNSQLVSNEKTSVRIIIPYSGDVNQFAFIIDSIKMQDYPLEDLEVVVVVPNVDLGESVHSAIDSLLEHWKSHHKILFADNKPLSVVKMWLFVDSHPSLNNKEGINVFLNQGDLLYNPSSLSTIVKVSKTTHSHIVSSSVMNINNGVITLFPACPIGLAVLQNCFGTRNVAVQKGLVSKLGDFEDQSDSWVFYLRAMMRGIKIETVVDPLFAENKTGSKTNQVSITKQIKFFSPSAYDQQIDAVKSLLPYIPHTFGTTFIISSHFIHNRGFLIQEYQEQTNKLSASTAKYKQEINALKSQFTICQDDLKSIEFSKKRGQLATPKKPKLYSLFFVRGHEKSGTTWLAQILRLHPKIFCPHGEFHFSILGDALEQFTSFSSELQDFTTDWFSSFSKDIIISGIQTSGDKDYDWVGEKTPTTLAPLTPNAYYFLIIRDGRDVVISLFWHFVRLGGFIGFCGNDMNLVDPSDVQKYKADSSYFDIHSEKLLSKEDCVRRVAKGWAERIKHDNEISKVIQNKQPPSKNNRLFTVRYEEILANPEKMKDELFLFLKLDPSVATPLNTNDFTSPSFKGIPSENRHQFFRKGVVGDWKNFFHEDAKRWFKEEAGDVLIHLGYERDDDW